MFAGWDGYYLVIGSAAGALIGLLFVVISLTSGMESRRTEQGTRVYMTGTVLLFGTVLVVSAISAVPRLPSAAQAGLVGLTAFAGLANAAICSHAFIGKHRLEAPHWSDQYFYGFVPALLYLALAATAVYAASSPDAGGYAIAAAVMALLLLGIRNAWDLATWIVQHRNGPNPDL